MAKLGTPLIFQCIEHCKLQTSVLGCVCPDSVKPFKYLELTVWPLLNHMHAPHTLESSPYFYLLSS